MQEGTGLQAISAMHQKDCRTDEQKEADKDLHLHLAAACDMPLAKWRCKTTVLRASKLE